MLKTATVLDGPDELLGYTACDTEVDAIGAVRALLEVLCDIEILATMR